MNWRMEVHSGIVAGNPINHGGYRSRLQSYVCGSCTDNSCSSSIPLVQCPAHQVITSIRTAQYGSFSPSSCSCSAYPGTTASSTTGPCSGLTCSNPSCTCGTVGSTGICSFCDASTTCTEDLASIYAASCVGQSSCAPLQCNGVSGVNDPCQGFVKTLLLEAECAMVSASVTPTSTPTLSASLPPGVYVCGLCGDNTCSGTAPLVTCPNGLVITNILAAQYGVFSPTGCQCTGNYTSVGACGDLQCNSHACICLDSGNTGGNNFCGTCSAATTCVEDLTAGYSDCIGQQSCAAHYCRGAWGSTDPCSGVVKNVLLEVLCNSPSPSPSTSITPSISTTSTLTGSPSVSLTPVYVCGSCTDYDGSTPCSAHTPIVQCPSGYAVSEVHTAQYGVFSFNNTCSCSAYPGTAATTTSGPCHGLSCNYQGECDCLVSAYRGICSNCTASDKCIETLVAQYNLACIGQPACYPLGCANTWGYNDPCLDVVKQLLVEVSCVSVPTAQVIHRGLPAGTEAEKLGIGLGVGLGLCALFTCLGCFAWCVRRRTSTRKQLRSMTENESFQSTNSERAYPVNTAGHNSSSGSGSRSSGSGYGGKSSASKYGSEAPLTAPSGSTAAASAASAGSAGTAATAASASMTSG